ncbi:tripartite tricarboxylate transporter substrate binding protein [Candidimonas humi]|uniref:Tripartite tricarboxylate transporter substrate binding protein n=1 Tax=Candidimonas humi TaxID=683355 RepID=A0ABV8NS95_9BURK|nr:tripartite tricarboxylate transporter substrate binding protein [Candidimonas humi]MBV6303302.1 tripartite tricarboxylate transporter substrate binding protein [Candidimonas humi]
MIGTFHYFQPLRGGILKLGAACLLAAGLAGTAHADGVPIKLVVPFAPGGSTDIASRIIQPKLAALLGRTVIVENKPGAATQIASQYVARSKPDGNTLLVSFDSHSINPIVRHDLPYDTFKDFRGIALALRFPLVIAASPSTPGKDLKAFLQAAREHPGKYSYASTGTGSLNYLSIEDLKRRAKVDILHVPFGGGGAAVQAVLGNVVNLTTLSYAALKAHIASGAVKALAVTGDKRLADLPNTPTVAESGFPGYNAYSWIGIFAPSGTPDGVAKTLTQAFQQALSDKEVKGKLEDLGFEVMAEDGASADRYALEQFQRWNTFVKENGISLTN